MIPKMISQEPTEDELDLLLRYGPEIQQRIGDLANAYEMERERMDAKMNYQQAPKDHRHHDSFFKVD